MLVQASRDKAVTDSGARSGSGPGPTSTPTGKSDRWSRAWSLAVKLGPKLMPVFAVLMFVLAIGFVHHLLKAHSYHEIRSYVRAIPAANVGAAIALTYFSYLVLSGYDFLGFRYIGRKLGTLRIIFASMTAFAFSNNIGLANLAGGSIRLRMYSTYGVDPADTLKVIAFVSVTFWCGFCALAGVLLTVYPLPFPPGLGLSLGLVRAFGVLLIAVAIGYVAACAFIRGTMHVRGHVFRLPSFSMSIQQIVIAACDWALAGFVLYLLLPESAGVTYPQFLTIFISAQVVALLAHVPGGVGVLEALVIYFVTPDHESNPGVLGALVAYRAIYYLLPLATAAASLVAFEVYRKRHVVAGVGQSALSWTSLMIPSIASVIAFLSGSLLLFSNATPNFRVRTAGLVDILPLSLVETSHFLSSCVGALLLILSRGLLSRSRAAWLVTVTLVVVSSFLSLAKGLEYEDAVVLGVFALILLGTRDQFHREAPLFREPWSPAWVAAVAMVVGCAFWIGHFTHKHLEYASEMWWTFAVRGDAPRFLRASVGFLITFAGVAAYHLLVPSRKRMRVVTVEPAEMEEIARRAGASSDFSMAGARGFVNEARTALIRYRAHGRFWIALGDPVGPAESFEDLIYDFMTAAQDAGVTAIFTGVHAEHLALFADLKMTFATVTERSTQLGAEPRPSAGPPASVPATPEPPTTYLVYPPKIDVETVRAALGSLTV